MYDAFFVGVVKCLQHLNADIGGRGQWNKGIALQVGLELNSVDTFHHDVRRVLLAAEIENGDDIGVQAARGGAGFL